MIRIYSIEQALALRGTVPELAIIRNDVLCVPGRGFVSGACLGHL